MEHKKAGSIMPALMKTGPLRVFRRPSNAPYMKTLEISQVKEVPSK
jgi:hypothetical protein